MTKFNQSTFSSKPSSKEFRDNFDAAFPKCPQCRNSPAWPKPDCSESEFHREAVAERLRGEETEK